MVKKIKLSQGKFAIVDDDDFEKINKYKWHFSKGYAKRNEEGANKKRTTISMHRIIANTPEGLFTDHIDGDGLNNRKENLRNVTQSQNAKNARKKAASSSKYKGVAYFKRDNDSIGKWTSRIQVDGETKIIGYFDTEIQAALMYNKYAEKYHKDFACFNVVETIDMTEYQAKASRTIPDEKWFKTKASNFCMGLSGEAGEVVDHIKKHLYHGHDLNKEYVKKELGDTLWYLTALATTLKMDLSDVAKTNIDKLIDRYPDGFSEKKSLERPEEYY